jgi:hypothetical protein
MENDILPEGTADMSKVPEYKPTVKQLLSEARFYFNIAKQNITSVSPEESGSTEDA